jgi:hypothetical protein
MNWQSKVLAATSGMFHAIIAVALDAERDVTPRFEGKAVVTSDGFVQCNFVSRSGEKRYSAFVGDVRELNANVEGLIKHLQLVPIDAEAFTGMMADWIGTDWRSVAKATADARAQ